MKTDEEMYNCPLLQRSLWMGDCYDINAVLADWVLESVLESLESEIGLKIDLVRAGLTCPKCRYYPFSKP